jgi:hypothetical protein
MDIKTKNTGRAFYQVPPDLATILLELGMVERIDKPTIIQPVPIGPKWGVTINRGGNTCIVLTIGQTTQWFDGDPDDAPTGFQRKNWMGQMTGHETPAHIVELYKAQLLPTDWQRINMMNSGRKRK